ncbi:hypothetical protein BZA77DRAFT_314685 [Pyronema omphalodes]|nr:hypothetical protein BZA77DRAFT_314685 [Pyronema omphalodes]
MPSTEGGGGAARFLRCISRVKFPTRPRRTIATTIELDDPHRVHAPDSIVTGYVCVTIERAVAILHLTVCLVGSVNVCTSAKELGKKGKTEHWATGFDGRRSGNSGQGFGSFNVCWDEMVLSGEGKLEPGVYKFGFELEFCKLAGVSSLPTSLDFEKGSISYTVVATLTRPTSTQTTQCSTKIQFMDRIDIAKYTIPKPRVIKLEPVSKRPHPSKKPGPRSVSPSTIGSTPNSSISHLPDTLSDKFSKNPIVATVELLNAGALRGENIGVKISIQHTKKITSVNGIILTLMRQTRFDPAGNIDDISLEKLKGSAVIGTASTFRKDLNQSIHTFIIDPITLTTVIKANIRVPPDVFPTITNVPGGAVEFRYWIEVMMDLGGKLNDQDLSSASVILPGLPRPTGGPEGDIPKTEGLSSEGGVMIETERIRRREKSVIVCKFEVIVGTVDTGKKGKIQPQQQIQQQQIQQQQIQQQQIQQTQPHQQQQQFLNTTDIETPTSSIPPQQQAPEYQPTWTHPQEPTDEKSRIRLAEQQLLPSSPGPSDTTPSAPPSAPTLDSLLPAHGDQGAEAGIGEEEKEEEEETGQILDKQEKDRLRLLAMESSPPLDIAAGNNSNSSSSSSSNTSNNIIITAGNSNSSSIQQQQQQHIIPPSAPSAPVLTPENGENGEHGEENEQDEDIPPQYHR